MWTALKKFIACVLLAALILPTANVYSENSPGLPPAGGTHVPPRMANPRADALRARAPAQSRSSVPNHGHNRGPGSRHGQGPKHHHSDWSGGGGSGGGGWGGSPSSAEELAVLAAFIVVIVAVEAFTEIARSITDNISQKHQARIKAKADDAQKQSRPETARQGSAKKQLPFKKARADFAQKQRSGGAASLGWSSEDAPSGFSRGYIPPK